MGKPRNFICSLLFLIFFISILLHFFVRFIILSIILYILFFSIYLLLHPPLRVILHYHSLFPVQLVLYCCGVQILAANFTDLQHKLPRWCGSRMRLTSDWCGEIMSWAARGSKEQINAEVRTRIDKQICIRVYHNLCSALRVFSVYRRKLNT